MEVSSFFVVFLDKNIGLLFGGICIQGQSKIKFKNIFADCFSLCGNAPADKIILSLYH